MPPKTRSSDLAAGKLIPALVNQGYFSEYYLAYRLDSGLQELYKRWDAAEKEGYPTPRTRLRSLSAALDKYRLDAALTSTEPSDDGEEGPVDLGRLPADGLAAQRDLNDAVLSALGWVPARGAALEMVSGDRSFTVRVASRCDTHAGTILVALDTVFATDPSTVVASKQAPAGTLLDPIHAGDRVEARTGLEAAQALFTADDPPNYLLLVSGGSVTLLDRDRWGEGIYLAANLDDALARHDTRPKGELAALAALFSAEVINPGEDAKSLLADLLEAAANESAGVSKDLRHGVRRSVELLANAVVRDVRERQKGAWRSIDPKDLTRQCLRYLYRIIVLLFAEARPELGILPVDDPDYQSGYSLARLRDIALRDLHTDHGRNAQHLEDSLALLFRLVNDGYEPEATLAAEEDSRGLRFRALRSVLFSEAACPLIDRSRIPDAVLQKVFEHLCFSPEQSGKQRQALSYATLGLNQLGAVYEGLMAYSGFLATEPLYEVDKDGDPDNGSWVIPVTRADELPDDVFLTEEGPGREQRRVRYETGDFVFRLSGRDRQRSASYYTPEVLTEFTVRHALDVFFAENPDLRAADILNLTVCEPALGSGAFLNEAINQLAARYLKAAQDEAGEVINPDWYQHELQKAKAHFAVNQAYGVDLNQTAVELAEVSVWLNCMHVGLDAPWFGARLRRGNSLLGARRATYTAEQVKLAAWTGKSPTPPTDQRLPDVPLGEATGIHHFLVPGEGWGVGADAKEIRELVPDWAEAVKTWRKQIHRKPSQRQMERLTALSQRVEILWKQAATEVTHFWEATRQHIDVWGTPTPPRGSHYGDQSIRSVLHDPRSAACRLRTVMDAWCSLWVWAPQHGTVLPNLDEWLDGTEALLGRADPSAAGVLFLAEPAADGSNAVEPALESYPWLAGCEQITEQQGWFHWELDFAPIFGGGGFDVQVGNPPWIRPRWDETAALAEHDPYFAVVDQIPDRLFRARREHVLTQDSARVRHLRDRAENAGVNALLDAASREPDLVGVQTNLYMIFMTNTWRRVGRRGTVGLLHPESHFVDPKAGAFRSKTYQRLREHWQFTNEQKLFEDVHNETEFGVHIYGAPRDLRFIQAVSLLAPSTADRSMNHDGAGEVPGIQHPEGGWDTRPHAARLVHIDSVVLEDWVQLFDPPGTPANESRLLRPLTTEDLDAIGALAHQPRRLAETSRQWTRGFDEDKLKKEGTGEWRTEAPLLLTDAILQGPHILNGTPFAQQPRPGCKSNKDWEAVDLADLGPGFIPRTNYQRIVSSDEFVRRQTVWDGAPYSTRYREAHREFVGSGSVRTLQACLLPPGPVHINKVNSIAFDSDQDTIKCAGLFMSLPIDYFTKISGTVTLAKAFCDSVPFPESNPTIDAALRLRVLRLNCVTSAYGTLWASSFDERWNGDEFVAVTDTTVPLAQITPRWSVDIPLRIEYARWVAFCEIDAIAALMLGLTVDQLLQMYRSLFPVLRKYEYQMLFDGKGRQIAKDHHAYGIEQARWEAAQKERKLPRGGKSIGMWERVQAYVAGDTDLDLGPFSPPFRPATREAAMTRAYHAFMGRCGLTAPGK